MAAAACDAEESSLFEWNQGQQGWQPKITTTFRFPPFPNFPPKMKRIRNSRSTKIECVYSHLTSRNTVIQQVATFVEQQMLHDVEPCVNSLI